MKAVLESMASVLLVLGHDGGSRAQDKPCRPAPLLKEVDFYDL